MAYFCVLDLQSSWGQDEGDEGGGEQHLQDGNVASISGFEAFGKGIGGEDTKASRGPCEMRLEEGPDQARLSLTYRQRDGCSPG